MRWLRRSGALLVELQRERGAKIYHGDWNAFNNKSDATNLGRVGVKNEKSPIFSHWYWIVIYKVIENEGLDDFEPWPDKSEYGLQVRIMLMFLLSLLFAFELAREVEQLVD